MSYIGRLPIKIPSGVSIKLLNKNSIILIEGPYGSKTSSLIQGITYKYVEDSQEVFVIPQSLLVG